ncbi:hypothetical protein PT447_00030 [Aliarcobacter butzleri]|uniref:hypothetical protein n=1 Tax=Aliarcobacter butzleri TaxID=28197 RepID=UPI0024DE6970|nr:hypothetical protein [Aliarcobacter butzleri]MDK2063306.1 hypothetical protein [Aliarcobacter butzleri]
MNINTLKKQKIFNSKEEETKYKKIKLLLDNTPNTTIISSSGKSSQSGGGLKISGGKVDGSQYIVIQGKQVKSGFDYKSGATLTKLDVGGKASTHIDYINRQKANLEENVFDQVFDDLNNNKLIEELKLDLLTENPLADFSADDYSIIEKEFTSFKDKEDDYTFKKNDDYSNNIYVNNKAQVDFLKDLKSGRIEASFKINDIDSADISKEFLNNLKENNLKLFREMDKQTGEINLYIQGTKDNLFKEQENIKNYFSNQNIESLTFSEIKDINSNIRNIEGNKLNYKEVNTLKKELDEKGIGASTRLEISPKENFNHSQLEELASKTMIRANELFGKDGKGIIFAVHSNTNHNHVHVDINGAKNEVLLSKEQLQTIKVIAAEVALEISPSKEAERHLQKEVERLAEAKLIQSLQDKYNDSRKENAEERHTNLSNLARAINKETGLKEDEITKIAQLEKLEGLAKFQENKIRNSIDIKEKETFEKRLGYTKKSIEKVKNLIDEKTFDKIEKFKSKWEEAKNSNHYKDLKEDYREKELEAVKDYSQDLKKYGKDKLAESVLKFGQGEKFNQFFDEYTGDRAIRNIFSDQFNDKLDLSGEKKLEVLELKDEFKNRESNRSGEVLKSESELILTDARTARNSIKQEEDPEGYRIEQLKFIDAQTLTRDGFSVKEVNSWGEWAKKEGMDEKIVEGFKEASIERADRLVNAGILKEEREGVYKFVDEKAKEILLENVGKSIDIVAEKNINAYQELKDIKENKIDNSLKIEEDLKDIALLNKEIKDKDINMILKEHKEEISEKFRHKL